MENALAADAQRRSLDSHASESEYSETTRSSSGRRRRTSRPSSRTIKAEKLRGITLSPTSTTGRSTPVRHGKRVSEDRKSVPIEEETSEVNQTPTKKEKYIKEEDEAQPDQHKVDLPGLRKIPSAVSIGATRSSSPSAPTPITPSLTTATSTTTDDEDTDFQSAYSASPRGSYGSFENFAVKTYDTSDGSEAGTPTTTGGSPDHLDDFGGRTSRDRASSTATAKDTKGRLRASQDTVTTATPRIAATR